MRIWRDIYSRQGRVAQLRPGLDGSLSACNTALPKTTEKREASQ
jgi:hypothetical protein